MMIIIIEEKSVWNMFIFNNLSISSTLLSVLLLLLALVVLLEVLLAFILDPTSASKLLKSGMAPLSNPQGCSFCETKLCKLGCSLTMS